MRAVRLELRDGSRVRSACSGPRLAAGGALGVWSPPAGTALVAMMMVGAGSADAGSRLAVSPAARIRLTVIYRIIQQALINATKHCHATRAVIETRENATTVGLGVRDDGDGFHPAAALRIRLARHVRARPTAPRSSSDRIVLGRRHPGHGRPPTAAPRPCRDRRPPRPPAEPVRVWSGERGAGSCSS